MMQQPSHYLYSDAVHYATSRVLSDCAAPRRQRIEELWELLYSLASSIPLSWHSNARDLLARRELSIDRILYALSSDLSENMDSPRYQVISSLLLLALTLKQAISTVSIQANA